MPVTFVIYTLYCSEYGTRTKWRNERYHAGVVYFPLKLFAAQKPLQSLSKLIPRRRRRLLRCLRQLLSMLHALHEYCDLCHSLRVWHVVVIANLSLPPPLTASSHTLQHFAQTRALSCWISDNVYIQIECCVMLYIPPRDAHRIVCLACMQH